MSKIEMQLDHRSDGFRFMGTIDRSTAMVKAIERQVIREVAAKVAERYITEHYAEIIAKMDPQAMANLSIAEGAAAIRETLEKKFPDRVEHHHHKEVVHVPVRRGFFGGWKL